MKSKKFFKTTMTSFAILGGTSLCTSALVSCGKKNTPPPAKATWDQFQKKARAESLYNIVQNANPPADDWKNLSSTDFGPYGNIVVNKPMITIKILAKSLSEYASFSISAPSDNTYKVGNWACSKAPSPTPSEQWTTFKTAAIAVTASDLLKQSGTDPYKKFHWIGDTTQQTWQTGQTAEFDVYGGNGGTDTYKGMSGTPVVSETNHTITAIISIANSNKRGNYDADPIQAVITDTGSPYGLSGWVFTQTKQLQSQQKYAEVFDASIGDLPNTGDIQPAPVNATWTHFAIHNYISNESTDHTNNNYVSIYLAKHQLSNWVLIRVENYNPNQPDSNNNRLKNVLTLKIWTSLNNPTTSYTVTLTSYFNFKDKSNTNVGSAFNFNWNEDMKPDQ